jgi:hypothetical protein
MMDVRGVKFDSLREDWVQMEIELQCEGNLLPEARDPDYVERIGVTAFLAYEIDAAAGEFDFYRAEVEIVAMEKGDSANVYFFLPGVIVERDQLPDEPYFYFVEIAIGGRALPLDEDGMGRRFRGNEAAIESLRSKAAAEGSENEFLLMPPYLAPVGAIGARMDDLPVFLRREPAAR